MSIDGNIAKIEERLIKACDSAGRKRDEITLMGVSKFEPEEKIKEAWLGGIRVFGESRVQEACRKFASLKAELPGCGIHLIGSLQRNKAKTAALLFDCVQSVDRIELIAELAKHVSARENPLHVMLELHTGEKTKSGFSGLDDLFKAADLISACASLKLSGLMTMAPFTADTNLIRSSFRQLFNARKELEKRFPKESCFQKESCFPSESLCLSMGMSNDFEIAVEEGSNMLRIGSAIFKEE